MHDRIGVRRYEIGPHISARADDFGGRGNVQQLRKTQEIDDAVLRPVGRVGTGQREALDGGG